MNFTLASFSRAPRSSVLPWFSRVIVACLICMPLLSQAQTMTVTFSGTLTAVTDLAAWDGSVAVSTPFTATFVYNPFASSYGTLTANLESYREFNLPYSSSVSFGNYSFTVPGFNATVYDNNVFSAPNDGFNMFNADGTSSTSSGFRLQTGGFFVQLRSSNTSLFSSPALSSIETVYATSSFDVLNQISLDFSYGSGFLTSTSVYGTITSYSVSAVPEPSTYAMVMGAVSLGGVMLWRRRERRAA